MKLQLLVPQWREDQTIIKNLLNSIETQQGIDLNEIGVIIVNDGSDVIIPDSFLESYSFKIDYYLAEHAGVSNTRNKCLSVAEADYVMFCDADDMFLSNCGLYLIFREIEKNDFDVLVSVFSEEVYTENKFQYVNHPNDSTFVHGKVYRRQYLIDNKLFWKNDLTIHEDSYFNFLSRACAKEDRIKFCNDVFYLWKYRPNSICREDKKYILKTLGQMVDSTESLAQELIRRGLVKQSAFICFNFIYNTYYDMNKEEWNKEENKEYLDKFMKRFVLFFNKYSKVADLVDKNEKAKIILEIKKNKTSQGVFFERFTYNQWIESFKNYE